MRFVCAGDCGIDLYLPAGESCVGGISANVARHFKDILPDTDSVALISCVGEDRYGGRVYDSLAQTGIDCLISRARGSTPLQRIRIDAAGERVFDGYDEGVLRRFHFDLRQRDAIAEADLLVTAVFEQIERLIAELLQLPRSGKLAVDFADFADNPDFELLERSLEHIDMGFFGLAPSQTEVIQRIADLARQRGKLLVVTLAGAGSRAFCGGATFEQAAIGADDIVDTTGAGDAFAAAFLCCHAGEGLDIPAALKAGAVLAGSVVRRWGSYGDVCRR